MRKKPYPDGLLKIAELSKAKPSKMLLIDDRLLTGVLATFIANTQAIWIKKPYVNLKKHWGSELLFVALRKLERWLV